MTDSSKSLEGSTLGNVVIAARGLSIGYAGQPFVRDLDIEVRAGEIVALLGSNGAGKSTTLAGLAGLLKPLGGSVEYAGEKTVARLYKRARRGLGYITQDRCVFMDLSLRDNFRAGGVDPEEALERFPELKPHLQRRVGLLSGGQQQMLAVSRVLARRPKVLLADELSLGLAPMVVDRILAALVDAARTQNLGVLLVEQQVTKAMAIADRVAIMKRGKLELTGDAASVRDRMDEVEALYL
ncbi:ABC transporter ATP-binding protein [Specibacter sp. RAF43]|uniref:ABC transporter ATP-binding protein n=1 Tax=Specibacter sp. RAF43 TaxID=3233057 RepID=UPI003F9A8398